MSQVKTSNTTESGDDFFNSADYFLGIAQRAIAAGQNACITLPGKGEVYLYPARKEFFANIPDMAEFFRAPAAQFQSTPLDAGASTQTTGRSKHISELLWLAAFHASQGRLVEGISKYDVVKFRQWPNLPHLAKTPNTERICALLTRHPTTIWLVHRQLGITRDEVCQVYSAAYSAGIVTVLNRNPQAPTGDETEDTAEPAQERGLFRSLFSKISGL